MTPGKIAEKAKVPVHRVLYVIRSRRITEDDRVGIIRVFSPAKVQRILKELKA